MFDVGWQELALTGVVALVVLGPKELPGLMRTAGKLMRKARMVAHEFRTSLDDMAEEAELDEFREKARKFANEQEPLLPEGDIASPPPNLPPAKPEGATAATPAPDLLGGGLGRGQSNE